MENVWMDGDVGVRVEYMIYIERERDTTYG